MFCAILIDRAEASESVEQIQLLDGEGWENFQEKSDVAILHWLSRAGFRGEVGQWCALPAQAGQGLKSVARVDREHLRENLAALAAKLPSGTYNVELEDASVDDWYQMGLGWALADYSFDSFKRAAENQRKLDLALGASNDDTEVEDTQAEDEDENSQTRFVELIFPDPEMAQLIEVECEATEIVRDLINTPANVMNPEGLEYAVRVLAEEKGAHFSACVWEDLLSAGFDAIYNVGKASES